MMENYLKNRIEEQIHINKGTAEIYLAIRQRIEARLTVRLLPQSAFIQPGTISRITKFDGIQSCLYITHNKIQVYVTLELLQIAGISQDEAWEMAHKNVAESCEILTIKDILPGNFRKCMIRRLPYRLWRSECSKWRCMSFRMNLLLWCSRHLE